ncbi:phage tail tube protein [Paenibacillus amylolyticus]|uniref:phage tail tube protein n=1 Tax=Paenibacillus amylolyticus TaxID=1451 RepID=UPI000B885842|nr:hypothetical protein [Paenibacillus amylolyticus]
MLKLDLQLFGGTGVFPVHNNIFKVGIKGRESTDTDMKTIKDLENFAPAIDGNTEEWSAMDQAGWTRRAVTGKSLSFSFSGKRNYGDPGNDYVAGLMLGTGQEVETIFEWTMPSGAKLTMNCVINLTTPAGGDSTNIDGLEFELLSDGKPDFEKATTTP